MKTVYDNQNENVVLRNGIMNTPQSIPNFNHFYNSNFYENIEKSFLQKFQKFPKFRNFQNFPYTNSIESKKIFNYELDRKYMLKFAMKNLKNYNSLNKNENAIFYSFHIIRNSLEIVDYAEIKKLFSSMSKL